MEIIEDISDFIFVSHVPEHSDIIFIPGGSHVELGEGAARLYHQGFAKWVLPSGGVSIKSGRFAGVKSKQEIYNRDYQSDCEFLVDVLMHNGVPESAILKEDQSSYTRENAMQSKRLTDEMGLHIGRAILCCKNFHARRALMCYQFAYPDTTFYVNPVSYTQNGVEITMENWYLTQQGIDRVLGELRRCGDQFTDDFMRRI